MAKSRSLSPVELLPPLQGDGTANVIVETPAGSRSKLKYEGGIGLFTQGKILPEGFAFPFDFGFLPGTRAEDGDPLDVMLVAEAGTATGCLVPARLLGILEAEESGAGKKKPVRNDRILAVPLASRQYADLMDMEQLPQALREQIEHFLTSYGVLEGKEMRIIGLGGTRKAARLVRKATRKARA